MYKILIYICFLTTCFLFSQKAKESSMKKSIKNKIWHIVFISFLTFTAQAQNTKPIICKDNQFNCAYHELADMLDGNDFAAQEDFTNYFVTKLMRTHSGQCRSLPMYYKILADEISAEAHITFAPQHLFIRHRHESDPNRWRNVELTTQSLAREIFYIEHFDITDEMIRNKVYMYPLTDRETVAYLLSELAVTYLRKYSTEDNFVVLSCKKSIEHFPQNILALIHHCNALNMQLKNHFDTNGNIWDEKAIFLDKQWFESHKQIEKLGYKRMNDKTYKKVFHGVIQSMRQQGLNEEEIKIKTEKFLKNDDRSHLNIIPKL